MTDIKTISRRTLVKTGIGALAAPAVLRVLPAQAQSQVIKIGHVSPKTGPLAGFGEADDFILRAGARHPEQGSAAAAARPTRSRSSPRTASRTPAAPPRSRPN